MAERIVSPGVFTRENDLSFLAQGIGEIGAAFVGPFKQGPAFVLQSLELNRNSNKFSEHLMELIILNMQYRTI